MFKGRINLKEELEGYRFEYDLLQSIPCSSQENKEYQQLLKDGGTLPEGVFPYVYDNGDTSKTEFYTVHETDLTESEIKEYLTYKKLGFLRTIKNCVVFFTVLAVIGLILAIVLPAL